MYEYEYPRPAVTVDFVVVANAGFGSRKLLTITRKHEPFKGMLALPGGFVDPDEDVIDAAYRELREETGLDARKSHGKVRLIGAFGQLGRDPRGWTISIAYAMTWPPELMCEARAGDDAAKVEWVNITEKVCAMAFDHADIVRAAGFRLCSTDDNVPVQSGGGRHYD